MQANFPRQYSSDPPGSGTKGSKSGRRHELGQFFTTDPVADFMASLFHSYRHEINLLDAGAGAWCPFGCAGAAFVRSGKETKANFADRLRN